MKIFFFVFFSSRGTLSQAGCCISKQTFSFQVYFQGFGFSIIIFFLGVAPANSPVRGISPAEMNSLGEIRARFSRKRMCLFFLFLLRHFYFIFCTFSFYQRYTVTRELCISSQIYFFRFFLVALRNPLRVCLFLCLFFFLCAFVVVI